MNSKTLLSCVQLYSVSLLSHMTTYNLVFVSHSRSRRRHVIGIVTLALAISFSSTNGYGQDKAGSVKSDDATKHQERIFETLEVGMPIEGQLRGGEEHMFFLNLDAGQYLNLVVEQRGIDVALTLLGPDSKPRSVREVLSSVRKHSL